MKTNQGKNAKSRMAKGTDKKRTVSQKSGKTRKTGNMEILDFDLIEEEAKPRREKEAVPKKAKETPQKQEPDVRKESKNAVKAYGEMMPEKPVTIGDETRELLELDELLAREESGKGKAAPKRRRESGQTAVKNTRSPKKKKEREDFGAMDVIIALTGVLVLFVVVVTFGVYRNAAEMEKQVAAMAEVGEKMESIGVAGESVFVAVADARLAAQEVPEEVQEETEEGAAEYEEKDLVSSVSVGLKLTSVQKDLKIKFTNRETGKLIGNQAFEVKIEGPETLTKTDDDKDGIIYISSITPGEYTVTITAPQEVESSRAAGIKENVTVKDKIEYKKIDVADEVKSESEINAAKEDTAVVIQEESSLKDTVEWVESTKTAEGGEETVYEEVKKSDIPDPSAGAMLDRIWMTDGKNGAYLSVDTVKMTENASFLFGNPVKKLEKGVYFSEVTSENQTDSDHMEEFPMTEPAEEDGEGEDAEAQPAEEDGEGDDAEAQPAEETAGISGISVTADSDSVAAGKSVTLRAEVDMSDGSAYTGNLVWTSDGGTISGSGTSVTLTYGGVGVVTVTATATTATESMSGSAEVEFYTADRMVTKISIPDSETVAAGQTTELALYVDPSDADDTSVDWKVEEGSDIVSVDGNGIVKGLKEGTAKIKAYARDGSGVSSNTCTVTVSSDVGVTMEAPGSIAIGEKKVLKCTTSGEISSAEWSVSDHKIAEIEADSGKVKGLAAGKVTVTVKVKGSSGKEASATGELTVRENNTAEVKLNPSKLTIKADEKATIQASVTISGDPAVDWKSGDESVAKIVETQDDKCVIQGMKPGKTTITAVSREDAAKTATAEVTVALQDGTALLKDKDGNQLYYKDGGEYKEATVADYDKYDVFYRKKESGSYRYTGWQTIDGKRYYYDKNGIPVTGDQIIQGMKYTFNSDGSLKVNGVMGIDVSKHNGNIDWNAVKNAGVNYVIIRCGYRGSATGVLVEDPKFKSNIQGATAAGLKVGIYFFSQAVNEVEAVEEASMTLSLIRNYKITYPVFLDVEAANGRADGLDSAVRTQVIKAYCETIRNSGYTAGIYANKTWLGSKMNVGSLGSYRIWLAQYAAAPTYGGRYEMWQYSSKGKISGVSGNVDLNISYLSY